MEGGRKERRGIDDLFGGGVGVRKEGDGRRRQGDGRRMKGEEWRSDNPQLELGGPLFLSPCRASNSSVQGQFSSSC